MEICTVDKAHMSTNSHVDKAHKVSVVELSRGLRICFSQRGKGHHLHFRFLLVESSLAHDHELFMTSMCLQEVCDDVTLNQKALAKKLV